MTRLWLLVAVAMLGACAPAPSPCTDVTPCPLVGQICREGQCEARPCEGSAQCPLGSWCREGACQPGCEVDLDCAPSDACDGAGQCAPRTCEQADLDCPFQHWCDRDLGSCVPAGDPFCATCSLATVLADCNAGDPEGSVGCWAGRCAVPCEAQGDCPSGFACVDLDAGDDRGPVRSCVAPCELYE